MKTREYSKIQIDTPARLIPIDRTLTGFLFSAHIQFYLLELANFQSRTMRYGGIRWTGGVRLQSPFDDRSVDAVPLSDGFDFEFANY